MRKRCLCRERDAVLIVTCRVTDIARCTYYKENSKNIPPKLDENDSC